MGEDFEEPDFLPGSDRHREEQRVYMRPREVFAQTGFSASALFLLEAWEAHITSPGQPAGRSEAKGSKTRHPVEVSLAQSVS